MSETLKNDPREINLSPAFFEAEKIRHKKRDYGGIKPYFPFGDKSFVQMIHVKSQRLVNLVATEAFPKNESIKDSLIDLINYASYYWEYLEGKLDE